MTSPLRSVNVDHVNRLMEAVRIGGALDMEKLLRVASDIGGYAPETDPGHKPAGWVGASDDTERFEWVSRWLGLKDPEAEILFGLGKPRYTPSGITREHLLAVLEAIREGEPVDRDIWARHDPDRDRKLSGLPPKTTSPQEARIMNMNMYVYRVTEKQDSESGGEPGEPFEAFNLSEAKRISTRRQKVKGSVLVLEGLTSRPHVVSTKGASGKWTDEEEEETSY